LISNCFVLILAQALIVPLVQCCYSSCSMLLLLLLDDIVPHLMLLLLFLLFQIVLPSPLFFVSVRRVIEIQVLEAKLGRWNFFFFNICLLMNFFNYPCFWEMLVDNVFFCYVQEVYGYCTLNYTYFIFFFFFVNGL
jgi:hypothetical protein